MVASPPSPSKRYYKIFYKGLGLAHWVYDREHFAVSVGFNRGTLLYSRGRWTKVKLGGDPGVFWGRESPAGRELWSLDGDAVHVVPWDKLLGRKSRITRRSEQISDGESVTDFCVIDDVALAVGNDGVFRRTTPVTQADGAWQWDPTLESDYPLIAIDGRSLDDIWVAGEESAWHYDGAAWKRVRLRGIVPTSDIACGSKYVFVCGGETLVRIGRGGQVTRFDAEGCVFNTAAFYKGEIYLNVIDADDEEQIGIWTLTRGSLRPVNTGFPPGWEHQPCGQLEVRAGLLWSFGTFGVYVFDGKRWKMLPNPKMPK